MEVCLDRQLNAPWETWLLLRPFPALQSLRLYFNVNTVRPFQVFPDPLLSLTMHFDGLTPVINPPKTCITIRWTAGLYNRSIARQLPDEKRATSFSVTSMTPLEHSSHSQERAEDDKEEWRRSEDEHEFRQHHIQHNELPEEGNAQFGKSITSENFHEESKADGVFEKEPGHREGGLVTAKYPIRTPEGEAALLRMRDIQKRRIGHWEDQEPIEGAKQHFSEGRDHTSAFDVKYADGWEESQELATPDPDAFDEESSTVNALHDRANTARKAAARAMKAARQAALSSALSAEAAEKAIRAANQASISASKCQSALDLRAEDLIEEAYTAAKQAEEAALSASREASVGSARAEMHRHDAERAAGVAVASADMSQPHGVVETVGAAWRSGRRAFHRSIQQVTSRVRSFSTSVAKDVEKGIHISRQWLTTTSVHIRDGFKSLFGRFSS